MFSPFRALTDQARIKRAPLTSSLLHCTRRNFRPVKNSGSWVCRSHQESIISSREHLDRRNNNTPSRSDIFTPKSNLESVGSEIGRCAVNTITFKLIERQRRGCMTPSQLSWVLLKQPSTHGQVVNSPTSLKFNLLRQFLVNGAKMLNLLL